MTSGAVATPVARGAWLVVAATLLSVIACPVTKTAGGASSGATDQGVLQAATSTERHGVYYLPAGYDVQPLPLLVVLHGTNATGAAIARRLQRFAEQHRFVVVAPDSVSVAGAWVVGQRPGDKTEDYRHILASAHEVLARPSVRIDRSRVLIAGYSVGGSAALYVASHDELFTAFAILHGHVAPQSLGPRRLPGWLSAGDRDRVRTVTAVRGSLDYLTRDARFSGVEMQVFATDHTLPDEELSALIAWWRRPGAG